MSQKELRRRIYWMAALLAVFAAAFLISVIFLNPSSVGNRNFIWFFNLWASVWALMFITVLVLTFVLARNLIKLFFEYQTPEAEGGIKRKLIITFIIFSLFPALIMFFVAFGLINQNLTKWVSAPSEQLLESSSVISGEFYRLLREENIRTARWLASRVGSGDDLEELAEESGFVNLRILNPSGYEKLELDSGVTISQTEVEGILAGEPFFQLIAQINRGEGEVVDQGWVAVPVFLATDPAAILVARFFVPASVSFHAAQVAEANTTYRGLKGTLASLRVNYFSILGLTTLAVVFGFVWLGSYIAKGLTVPLEALAVGSHQLAEGNLDHRVEVKAVDELEILVNSFNRMAAQLKENQRQLERANEELSATIIQLDERRRYIETVLQNVATAVLTVDDIGVIRTANDAAHKLLQAGRGELVHHRLEKITDPDLFEEYELMKKRAQLYGTCRRQISFRRSEQRLLLAATLTQNVSAKGQTQFLVVLDDLTELIRAEKFSAWQEVARRLAHEIKNPLTPIQLSAERLKKQFDRLAGEPKLSEALQDFGRVLNESTRVIVSEAEILKNLVVEFSRFARLPICEPKQVRLHELLLQTLGLYDGSLEAIRVERELDPAIQEIRADPEQLQRVFMNLIDNSLDALAEASGPRVIGIRTALNSERGTVRIEFEDTGVGIPPEDYEHLFLPYFSTKKKGTGLGLAIVRQIVSEHNGFVRAEPHQPRGTRFIMELPVGSRHSS